MPRIPMPPAPNRSEFVEENGHKFRDAMICLFPPPTPTAGTAVDPFSNCAFCVPAVGLTARRPPLWSLQMFVCRRTASVSSATPRSTSSPGERCNCLSPPRARRGVTPAAAARVSAEGEARGRPRSSTEAVMDYLSDSDELCMNDMEGKMFDFMMMGECNCCHCCARDPCRARGGRSLIPRRKRVQTRGTRSARWGRPWASA